MSRLAYVIGVNDYDSLKKLNNPINDMKCMKKCLLKAGFIVKDIINPEKSELADFLYEFECELVDKDIGLLYFAGHGVEIEGKQYLLPKDAKKAYENMTADKSIVEIYVDITKMINKISRAENFTGIIILDCCREQITKIENDEQTRGMIDENNTIFSSKQGIFISFSTGPNLKAKDGSGENGLFMKYLKEYINEQDIRIEEMFKKVRFLVVQESNYEQIPWEHSSLVGDFYFMESFSKKYYSESDKNINQITQGLYEKKLPYSKLKTEINNIFEEIIIEGKIQIYEKNQHMKKEEFEKGILSLMDELYLQERGLING